MAASSNSDPKTPDSDDHEADGAAPLQEAERETAAEQAPLILKRDDDEDEGATPPGDATDDAATQEPDQDASPEAAQDVVAPSDAVADPAPVTSSRKGGFLPLFLGGVAAAALGFGLARYAVPEGWPTPVAPDTAVEEALSAQSDRIAALEAALAGLADAPAPVEIDEAALAAAVEARIGETLRGEQRSALDGLSDRIDTLTADLAALAARPDPELSAALTDDQLAALQANLDTAVAEARAEMEAALAAAAAAEAAADRNAQIASARAAFDRVRAATEAGTPYAEALDPIRAIGAEIPPALSAAAEAGVPALSALQEEFPDAARAALDASIRAGGSEAPIDRALAFLRTQTGARSLTPREGDDPDAVLSRAEAALRGGDLPAALAELDALPDAGQAELSGWRAQAETRAAALDALADLAQALDAI